MSLNSQTKMVIKLNKYLHQWNNFLEKYNVRESTIEILEV